MQAGVLLLAHCLVPSNLGGKDVSGCVVAAVEAASLGKKWGLNKVLWEAEQGHR